MINNLLTIILLVLFVSIGHTQSLWEVTEMTISSERYDEYGNVPYKDGVVFSSTRKSLFFRNNKGVDNKLQSNIYFSKTGEKTGARIKIFSDAVYTKYFEYPSYLDESEMILYITQNQHTQQVNIYNYTNPNHLGIYAYKKNKLNWEPAFDFEHNDTSYNTAHLTMSKNKQIIVFSSDRDGGVGGSDLYYCIKVDSGWSQPKNIGSTINTSRSELYPFLHENGRLYFCSNGHHNREDLDIYYSDFIRGEWQKPIAMESPINSNANEYSPYFAPDFSFGYFSSERNGTADIFKVKSTFPEFVNCDTLLTPDDFCYVFYEKGKFDLDTMPLMYEWDFGNGVKVRGEEAEHCFEKPGDYKIALNVINTFNDSVMYNEAELEITIEGQVAFTFPEKLYTFENTSFDASKTAVKDVEIKEFYWLFDDGIRKTGMKVEHTFKSEGKHSVILGVKGIKNQQEVLKCVVSEFEVLPMDNSKKTDWDIINK